VIGLVYIIAALSPIIAIVAIIATSPREDS